MTETKFCKDCKWFVRENGGLFCSNADVEELRRAIDEARDRRRGEYPMKVAKELTQAKFHFLVTGEHHSPRTGALFARGYHKLCGEEGRFWGQSRKA